MTKENNLNLVHKLEGEEKFTPEYVDAYKEKISNMMKSHKNTSDLEWDLKKLRTTESTDYYIEVPSPCQGPCVLQTIAEYFQENLVKRDPETYAVDQEYEIIVDSKPVGKGESLEKIFSTLEEAHSEKEELKGEPIERPATLVEFRRKDGIVRFFLGYSPYGGRIHSLYRYENWLQIREVPREKIDDMTKERSESYLHKLTTRITSFIKGLYNDKPLATENAQMGKIFIKADYDPRRYYAIVDNDEEKRELEEIRSLVQSWTSKPVTPCWLTYCAGIPPGQL